MWQYAPALWGWVGLTLEGTDKRNKPQIVGADPLSGQGQRLLEPDVVVYKAPETWEIEAEEDQERSALALKEPKASLLS